MRGCVRGREAVTRNARNGGGHDAGAPGWRVRHAECHAHFNNNSGHRVDSVDSLTLLKVDSEY